MVWRVMGSRLSEIFLGHGVLTGLSLRGLYSDAIWVALIPPAAESEDQETAG